MRTLIIDNEEYVCLVLEQALREEGCEVTAVSHGAAGIETLQTTTFECVITDLRMPGLDGRAVLKWVREHQPDVDVLMLTGHGDVKDAVEAIKQGAWDFLVKGTPFDAATVKAVLARLNTVRALRKEPRGGRPRASHEARHGRSSRPRSRRSPHPMHQSLFREKPAQAKQSRRGCSPTSAGEPADRFSP